MVSTTSDRFVEALARLQRFAESASAPRPGGPAVTIALSREGGSGGAAIARAVGEKLGWPVYDHELLTRIAEEKGLTARLLEQLDERHMGWLEEMVASFCLQEGSRETTYLRSLLELFAGLSKEGHCVIVGRGSAQVLPAENTLRVRVHAPRAHRVAQIERRLGCSRTEAERWIDRTDRERKRFVEHYFHRDPNDPAGYDLVLNAARLGVSTCADLVAHAAREMEDPASSRDEGFGLG